MSTSIPAPVTRPVVAVLPVDEPGEHAGRPPVAERDESRDLPEGALAWLAQLRPLPEPLYRPSTGLKEAPVAAPKKNSVAVPMVAQPQAGVPVQGQLAATIGTPVPAPTLLSTTPARPLQSTPAMQLPVLPVPDVPRVPGNRSAALAESAAQPVSANAAQGVAIKPELSVATTPAMQLPVLPVPDVPRVPGNGAAPLAESAAQPMPANAAQGVAVTGSATTPATTPAMQLPVPDVPRVPGNGSAALAESPAQPVPANALQGVATTASPTPMAQTGAEPGATSADGDTPPPQSAQPLPPGFERAARAQAAAPQAAFNPPPAGKPGLPAEKAAQPYLQVPFSKGDCAGVVTINKAPADMPPQLLLSPSNAQVSGHLRDGLELAPQTLWQLNEQHEQAHDERRQHDTGDDEPQGDAPQPLARMLALQGMQP